MAKLLLVLGLVIFGFAIAITCTSAAMYTVGDNSGWDISTDLDTWTQGKRFVVGDVLLFQYSSIHSVDEVTKENFPGCNTTNVLQSGSNGNTTIPLTQPGNRYFVCGNKLHCYGGMKLQVTVDAPPGSAPAAAPTGASLPTTPSSKTNNPSAVIPSSAMVFHVGMESIFLALLGFVATFTLPWLV